MKKKELPIETVITRLGYENSKNLIFRDKGFDNPKFSAHTKKILSEIQPYAVYILESNSKPFIFFFDKSVDRKTSKQVWNSQVPIAFFCDENTVKVYNSTSLNIESYLIKEVAKENIDNCSEHSEFSYLKISDPLFWDKYDKKYSGERLNDHLLANITSLTNELKDRYHINFATKLVLRLIFIRYLIDRGVDLDYKNFNNDKTHSQEVLLSITRNRTELYNLFQHLKDKFNGNLFEPDNEFDSELLTDEVLKLITDFLSGTVSIGSGQLSLFSMYDFNIIPVELISNIYEILLGKKNREQDKAFYTPNYLVEYILDKTTLDFLKQHKKYKILDPSCGSGVFLVDSYRRMIEENLGNELYCDDDTILTNLLLENIHGIDINEDAIDVTIFSLYLTILDYKDPKTLSEFILPNLKGKNLVVSDFFDDVKLSELKNINFDFIIGNPPWGSVIDGLHMDYCKKNGYIDKQQNNEICRSFVFRAKDFSSKDTICSFVLHSTLLYTQKKPSIEFRKFLLEKTKIVSLIEMSSVRNLVFKNARPPAIVLTFQYNDRNDNLTNKIVYTTFKPNIFSKLFNIIVIEKYDVKYVLQNMLHQNDWAWKTIVYGFSKDIDIIMNIKKKYPTVNEIIAENNFVHGTGIQINGNESHDATHLKGKWYVDSKKGIDSFYIDITKGKKLTQDKMRRPKANQQEIFIPPYVLLKKGVDTKSYRYRAAFSNDTFVYSDAVTGICGKIDNLTTLYCLAGMLNSSFYSYLNLMLGASTGIEREQGFPTEIFKYPVIEDIEISKLVEKIQTQVKLERESFFDSSTCDSKELIYELDQLILKLFDFQNDKFIDYALNIQIPELTKKTNIYEMVSENELRQYGEYFEQQFSSLYERAGKHIMITLCQNVLQRFASFELTIVDEKPSKKINFKEDADDNKEFLTKLARYDYNDRFCKIRDIIHFEENSFFIVKPNYKKNWHPAIAEMDLADALDQILTSSGGDE